VALDVAICGCGPAGLSAALFLQRLGHNVRIFERFEAPQPVGSGLILQPPGLAVLGALGCRDAIDALGARIERLFGRAVPSQRVVLDIRYRHISETSHGLAVHRAALFGVLHEAVRRAGIEVIADCQIARVEATPDHARLLAADERELGRYDLVVDALGARSVLVPAATRRRALDYGALWVNLPWPEDGPFAADALEQRYQCASRMAGVLPIGRRQPDAPRELALFWSLKRADLAAWRARPLGEWKAQVAALWPAAAHELLHHVVAHEQFTFAQYEHFTQRLPCSHRLVHIGDSAHATSPQLGQGANMALLDAAALAHALEQHGGDLALALPQYARLRRRHVQLFQWASAMFTPFYQSDSRVLPLLRDRLVGPVSRIRPADTLLARLVAGQLVAPIRGVELHRSFDCELATEARRRIAPE
jgi:salicylate hydroxylase